AARSDNRLTATPSGNSSSSLFVLTFNNQSSTSEIASRDGPQRIRREKKQGARTAQGRPDIGGGGAGHRDRWGYSILSPAGRGHLECGLLRGLPISRVRCPDSSPRHD